MEGAWPFSRQEEARPALGARHVPQAPDRRPGCGDYAESGDNPPVLPEHVRDFPIPPSAAGEVRDRRVAAVQAWDPHHEQAGSDRLWASSARCIRRLRLSATATLQLHGCHCSAAQHATDDADASASGGRNHRDEQPEARLPTGALAVVSNTTRSVSWLFFRPT